MARVQVHKESTELGQQARVLYQYVDTPEAWNSLTNAQKNEVIRKVIKWLLRKFLL